MNHQMDNLSRLINKYANRFGEQDLLVIRIEEIHCFDSEKRP
jgi:hypothetical protein